jgi:uncharacterized protein involved in outer membrane biogenesis
VKWVLLSIAGILFLGVLAVLVITSVIDPNRYRGKVEAIVADLGGRPLVIDDQVQLADTHMNDVRLRFESPDVRP